MSSPGPNNPVTVATRGGTVGLACDHTVSVTINNEPASVRTELRNGDIVEIVTDANSRPSPSWLSFVRTGKARSAIRHHLRTINLPESIALGVNTAAAEPGGGFGLQGADFLRIGERIAWLGLPTVFVLEGGQAGDVGINTVNVLEGFETAA